MTEKIIYTYQNADQNKYPYQLVDYIIQILELTDISSSLIILAMYVFTRATEPLLVMKA